MTWHRVGVEQPALSERASAGARNGRSHVQVRPRYAKMAVLIGSGSATLFERRSRVVLPRLTWVATWT